MLTHGDDFIIRSAKGEEEIQAAWQAGERLGFSWHEIGARIAWFLGQVVGTLMDTKRVSGLVLTGGDTAIKVAGTLGAAGLEIKDEVLP